MQDGLTPPILRESGLFSEQELALFWNPRRYPASSCRVSPRFTPDVQPGRDDAAGRELGLIVNSRHASPVHSNCPVNWLLMYPT